MVNKIDSSERLLAGVILIIFSLMGLMYRLTGFESIVREKGYSISNGYSLASIFISLAFAVILIMGLILVYNVIHENKLEKNTQFIKDYLIVIEGRNKTLKAELEKYRKND
jgi:hypothetical protein